MDEQRKLLADKVLEGMSIDGLSMTKACVQAGVKVPTFLLWCSNDTDLAERYARARADLIECMAEELLQIADEPVGTLVSGGTDNGAVQKQRLQVDTRKWLLSKLAPQRYGEKQLVEMTGKDGGPIKSESVLNVSGLSTEALAEIMSLKDATNAD